MKKTRNNAGRKGLLFYIITPVVFSLIIIVVLTVCLTPVLARYSFVADLFYDAGKNISNVDTDATDSPDEITISSAEEGDVYISEITHPAQNKKMGIISVENTDINCDLYFGDSDYNLDRGAELYVGSNLPGAGGVSLIAGHCASFFSTLGSAQIGDLIKIETTYGTYTYKITETVVKKATDPTAYDPTKTDNSIVLYTCYPFNTIISVDERYFVYADFVSGPILIKE